MGVTNRKLKKKLDITKFTNDLIQFSEPKDESEESEKKSLLEILGKVDEKDDNNVSEKDDDDEEEDDGEDEFEEDEDDDYNAEKYFDDGDDMGDGDDDDGEAAY